MDQPKHLVAIIGAGPAGLYAAKQLANAGVHVVIFNRDIKPGGLAEYGIYPDKVKMKEGLRNQFRQILELPQIEYYGNIVVGQAGDLSLDELRAFGFQALLVTVGAQGTKWLGLSGENLHHVYHAKECVYRYNKLPPFSTQPIDIGQRAAIVGAGNVMTDIAHWLIHELKITEVVAVVRRGPAEVKFSKPEMEVIVANLDVAALDAEISRVATMMQAIGQNPVQARTNILAALPHAVPKVSETRLRFEFLASPTRLLGDEQGNVIGLEVEDNTLVRANDVINAKGLGTHRVLNVDTVIFAIGDRVDANFGLPLQGNEFAKNPKPCFPIDDISYEAFDPQTNMPLAGVFLAGWARLASTGLVGIARKDGERGARAVLEYLQTLPPYEASDLQLSARLQKLGKPVITFVEIQHLMQIERAEAQARGSEDFKFATNEEMFEALKVHIP